MKTKLLLFFFATNLLADAEISSPNTLHTNETFVSTFLMSPQLVCSSEKTKDWFVGVDFKNVQEKGTLKLNTKGQWTKVFANLFESGFATLAGAFGSVATRKYSNVCTYRTKDKIISCWTLKARVTIDLQSGFEASMNSVKGTLVYNFTSYPLTCALPSV